MTEPKKITQTVSIIEDWTDHILNDPDNKDVLDPNTKPIDDETSLKLYNLLNQHRRTLDELHTAIHKKEWNNLGWLMTEMSCEADEIYKTYTMADG